MGPPLYTVCMGTLNYANMIKSTCTECGEEFDRPAGRIRKRCYECAAKAQVGNLISQHTKSGPTYEAMVKRCLRFYRSEAKRLGIRA